MANMGRGGDEHYELDTSDEFHTYDATDGNGGGRTVLVILIFLIAALGFVAVLYLAYQQGMKEGIRNAPPVIEADQAPMKVVPDDPGGMEIPNTDKLIYDRLNGDDPDEPGVEHLLPQAEEPMAVEEAPAPSEPTAQVPPRETIEVLPPALDVVPLSEDVSDAPSVEGQPESIIPVPVAPTNRQPAPSRAPPAVLPGTVPRTAVPPQAAIAGKFVVQIAAFRDVPGAENEFSELQAAHPDLLGGLRSDIERADLGDRGIYYRLRVGPFETKDGAASLCTRLKGRGQDCIVRER